MITFSIPSVYEALDLVMKYYPDNFNSEAKIEIETLFAHCLEGLSNDSEKFLTTLFIKSLKSYIGPSSINEHIYLKKFEIPQIQLFNILIKEFPFVRISQQITNILITSIIKYKKKVTIIDIGIGQGTQIKNLLEKFNEFGFVEKVTIIGIEPFNDALKIAEKNILEFTEKVHFELEFRGINEFVEKVDFENIYQFISESESDVIVNASLALHHIQTLKDRMKVIHNVRKLNPVAFFLIEPNVDHFEPDFYRRFQNCYRHFYNNFQVIDKLHLDEIDKNALKLFFGREIEDIIGKHENERYEKHEPAYRWIERLENNGFKMNENILNIPIKSQHGIKINYHNEGFLGFTFGTETILSIIYAECK